MFFSCHDRSISPAARAAGFFILIYQKMMFRTSIIFCEGGLQSRELLHFVPRLHAHIAGYRIDGILCLEGFHCIVGVVAKVSAYDCFGIASFVDKILLEVFY